MRSKNDNPHHVGKPCPMVLNGMGEMRIPPHDLSIIWGEDDRYWNVPNNENKASELHQVSWLEVTGSVNETDPNKDYEVGFEVSLAPDAFGWHNSPVYIMVKRGTEGKFDSTKVLINPNKTEKFKISGKTMNSENAQASTNSKDLHFGLYEVWSGKWKGGLRIHHAFIRELGGAVAYFSI